MSLPLALARVDQIERALVPSDPAATSAAVGGAAASIASPLATAGTGDSGSFASLLQGALPAAGAPSVGVGTGSPASAICAIAGAEVGQSEQPPGSNDSPRIAQYRMRNVLRKLEASSRAHAVAIAIREAAIEV
jgi:hypothetical protein